jgi:hypothetical protein
MVNGTLGEFNASAENILLGSRWPEMDEWMIVRTNVLSHVDAVDKDLRTGGRALDEIPPIRHMYDQLSALVHPNVEGVALSYGQTSRERLLLDMRAYQPDPEGAAHILLAAIGLADFAFKDLRDGLPEFSSFCEETQAEEQGSA